MNVVCVTSVFIFSFFFFKFIYLERESANREGAETEGERESQAGSELSAQSPTWGSNPQTVRS